MPMIPYGCVSDEAIADAARKATEARAAYMDAQEEVDRKRVALSGAEAKLRGLIMRQARERATD